MIPFPANWLKSQPWTRIAKPREPPLTAGQRRQRELLDAVAGKRKADQNCRQ
jgi:hypothetical protein